MATIDSIKIKRTDPNATKAGDILQAQIKCRELRDLLNRIKAEMSHNFNDVGVEAANIDWSAVETLWGLPVNSGENPSIGPGSMGSIVFTMIDGGRGSTQGDFASNGIQSLAERIV